MRNDLSHRTYRYDQLGRLIAANFEDGVTFHYSYDAASSLVSATAGGTVRDAGRTGVIGDKKPEASLPGPQMPAAPQARAALARADQAVLIGISGEYAGNELPLDEDWTTLGRDPEQCQLIFTDQSGTISRVHCRLRFEVRKEAVIVQDLGSSNGTWLQSGVRLDAHRDYLLAPGERFYLGTGHGTAFEMGIR